MQLVCTDPMRSTYCPMQFENWQSSDAGRANENNRTASDAKWNLERLQLASNLPNKSGDGTPVYPTSTYMQHDLAVSARTGGKQENRWLLGSMSSREMAKLCCWKLSLVADERRARSRAFSAAARIFTRQHDLRFKALSNRRS